MKPFLTGSRAYGTPREDSDIDIVLPVTKSEWLEIYALANPATTDHYAPVFFGKLNLILCNMEGTEGVQRYEAFKNAHEELILIKPVTREKAIEVHNKHRELIKENSKCLTI